MASYDEPVVHRTNYYETIKVGNSITLRDLPFATVVIANASKVFEPVDCMSVFDLDNKTRNLKAVHNRIEFDGKAKLFQAEDDLSIGLHSFESWGWPIS